MITKQIGTRTETFNNYNEYLRALDAQSAVESRREAGRGYITEEMEFSIKKMDKQEEKKEHEEGVI